MDKFGGETAESRGCPYFIYGTAVYEKNVTARSSDGKPLIRLHRRKFSAVLDDAPREIKDYAVIVNSVDVVNVIIQERDGVF